MGEALACRHDDAPFQLWTDLGCPSLRDFHPISSAIFEVHWKRDQKRQGIVPLSECHIVAELPNG